MKRVLNLLLVVALAIAACGFSCSNNGGSSPEPREFYIEDYTIKPVWYYCWLHIEPTPDQPLDSGSAAVGGYFEKAAPEILETPEAPYEDQKMYILYPGQGYMLYLDYFNDQEETNPTSWIAFEVFVDGERYSSSGIVIEKNDKIKTKPVITLFNPVPWHFEGKEVVIDVWLEDESGVQSEVFTFQVSVMRLWFPK